MEKKLTLPMRTLWILVTLLDIGLLVLFGYMAWTMPSGLPLIARAGFVLGAIFCLVWLGISVHVLREGSVNLKTDENMVYGLTWVFMILMMTLFLVITGLAIFNRVVKNFIDTV